jgi:hypothetical protein
MIFQAAVRGRVFLSASTRLTSIRDCCFLFAAEIYELGDLTAIFVYQSAPTQ